jgi:hypothetical protein
MSVKIHGYGHFSPFRSDILRNCFLVELGECVNRSTDFSEWKPADAPGVNPANDPPAHISLGMAVKQCLCAVR